MPNSSTTKTPELKDVKDKVGEEAKEAKNMAQGVAHTVANKADDATAATGRGMQSVAETIREHTPDKGVLGAASRAVTDTIDRGGRYLEHEKLSGMAHDFTDVIRNHPVPALLVAMGVGFLLARAMSSRS